jgi:ABC-type polysaccharide/polyol phosphate transport system ATPase subunit
MSQSVVQLDRVSKCYHLSREPYPTLKEKILRRGRRRGRSGVFFALNDVSLQLERGEILGIIGDNGSGKSTLLKIIAGITNPTRGNVTVRGTVASLLEVGVGFHPELTGRENIYLSGVLLGIPQDTLKERVPDIIDFAGIDEFIDTPVKYYSSGMFLRLGFAVGAYVDPDLLLVDEVLAVGDQMFRRKCASHLRQIAGSGKTVLLVSHDMDVLLSLCSRAVVLDRGRIIGQGHPYEMIGLYKQHMFEVSRARGVPPPPEVSLYNRFGDMRVLLTDVKMYDSEGCERYVFDTGESVRIDIHYQAPSEYVDPVFGLSIHDDHDIALITTGTHIICGDLSPLRGCGICRFLIRELNLLEGYYSLSVALTQREAGPGSAMNFFLGADYHKCLCPFMVRPGAVGRGLRGTTYVPVQAEIVTQAVAG